MNILSIDLTHEIHYVAAVYAKKKYLFEFSEETRSKRNDWDKKIESLATDIPNFDFSKLDVNLYAAGPGSYTGARLAYTFLSSLEYIHGTPFHAISNLHAMNPDREDMIAFYTNNNKDFFYRYKGIDKFTNDIKEVTSHSMQLIGFSSNHDYVNETIPESMLVENMLDIHTNDQNLLSRDNYPNYIKELSYKKL